MNNVSLRSATIDDLKFLSALHPTATKSYVERTWGWDEQGQDRYFREHFDTSTRQVIQYEAQDVGFTDIKEREGGFHLANIEIVPL